MKKLVSVSLVAVGLIPAFIIALFTMWNCSKKDTAPVIIYQASRDNHVNVMDKLISIEENLPDMHSFTMLTMIGDTLLLHDHKGELQFTAYDIYADTTIGRFGKFGSGPGEVANFGGTFYDSKSKRLYGHEGNRSTISYFYLPEAISNPDYNVIDKFRIGFVESLFVSAHHINDSTIICAATFPGSDCPAEFQLATFSLITKNSTPLDSVSYYDKARFALSVDLDNNRIYATDFQQDVISIYSLDGNLIRRIFGPEYTGKVMEGYRAFSTPHVCGKHLIVCYSGHRPVTADKTIPKYLIVTDLDGNYIKTLDLDFSIHTIAYHAKTNRLYLSTDGEPQFCYINLDDLKL